MNNADNTQDRGLTTEQIAAAGSATGQDDVSASAAHRGYDDDCASPFVADYAASGDDSRSALDTGNGGSVADTGNGSVAADHGPRASLLEDGELQSITMRWKDIQAEFVDEPTKAVQEADALVAELMQRLAMMFATERAELENRWSGGDQVSTEDLRQGLRRYRSFFERLLAA